ncbi:TauD-domain-containing protein [Nadsonia fulvescens var. elongata DSM 6958]|uniref:TauD-domain-containing protein n=1 Tax=Nadsonia fulvescens var. elongata DSM 6958 TaxID=857566 RepID=A0A1E3PM34_9ASCO|nr:TauD-domain-containing protein [Nadsonia fulvescens var. elongata DSM 6958]
MSAAIIEAIVEHRKQLRLDNIISTQDELIIEKEKLLILKSTLKYKAYAPVWNRNDDYEEAADFEHIDRGHFADPALPNLFPKDKETKNRGVQISELSDKSKDELALFVAQRGVVIFRGQDLIDKPITFVENLGRYFGVPQIHPTEPNVASSLELFSVYSPKGENTQNGFSNSRNNIGADTIYADTVQAYERLSPKFKKCLEGLRAVHIGVEQAFSVARGGITRRKGIKHDHPVVRTHPITKQKSLYVNPVFTRSIVDYKKEKSDFLLNFLYDQITKVGDIQYVWDNRVVQHAATLDWGDQNVTRHLVRITPQAEKPTEHFDF